jgi:hypothetical protein
VAWLKEELEGLKIQHGKELSLATESAKKEVATLKEEHARELAEVKNNWRTEVKNKDQVIEAIKHLRDLMEEQRALSDAKMNNWKEVVAKLDQDMEGTIPTYFRRHTFIPRYLIPAYIYAGPIFISFAFYRY